MSGPDRTHTPVPARASWTPDQSARGGVTCPACGLANEPGARVCRNCGLPIASATDPLRGVRPNRVEIAGASRSGLGSALGLAMVVGLLLVGGTLAVSGGGILDSGGRLGVDPGASPSAGADPAGAQGDPGAQEPDRQDEPDGADEPDGRDERPERSLGTSFDYTCEDAAITDLSRGRWQLSQFRVGQRLTDDGNFDRITWELTRRRGRKAGSATDVTLAWITPDAARREHGADLVSGQRAILVTFDGPISATVGQQIDDLSMEPEGVVQIRTVDMYTGEDGKVRTVIGLRGDSCARMSSQNWGRRSDKRNGRVYLDLEKE
jgi:hypothetical protein